jgi:predicted RNase H-like HicB family nuclease
MTITIPAILKEQSNGSYYAECPGIDGCYTQGDTYKDAVDNLRDLAAAIISEETDPYKRQIAGSRCLVSEITIDA